MEIVLLLFLKFIIRNNKNHGDKKFKQSNRAEQASEITITPAVYQKFVKGATMTRPLQQRNIN